MNSYTRIYVDELDAEILKSVGLKYRHGIQTTNDYHWMDLIVLLFDICNIMFQINTLTFLSFSI